MHFKANIYSVKVLTQGEKLFDLNIWYTNLWSCKGKSNWLFVCEYETALNAPEFWGHCTFHMFDMVCPCSLLPTPKTFLHAIKTSTHCKWVLFCTCIQILHWSFQIGETFRGSQQRGITILLLGDRQMSRTPRWTWLAALRDKKAGVLQACATRHHSKWRNWRFQPPFGANGQFLSKVREGCWSFRCHRTIHKKI